MKAFAVCLLLVAAVCVANELPLAVVCSIQGTGKAYYRDRDDGEYIGTVEMKRVYSTARYDMILKQESTNETLNCTMIYRPDLQNEYTKCYISGTRESTGDMVNYITTYKYDADFKPVADLEYDCYASRYNPLPDPFAALLISKDGKKLVAEYVGRPRENYTFIYDEVKPYAHYEIDDVFSIPDFSKGGIRNNATEANSSLCPAPVESSSASMFAPSVVAIVAAIAMLFF